MKKRRIDNSKIFFIILLALLTIMSFLIVRPFFVDIFLAFVFAYAFSPIYRWIYKKLRNKNAAVLIVTALAFLAIAVPTALLIGKILSEVSGVYTLIQNFITQSYTGIGCSEGKRLACKIYTGISEVMDKQPMRQMSIQLVSEVTSFLSNRLASVMKTVPGIVFHLFIIFFTMFFLLRDSEEITKAVWNVFMIKESHRKRITESLNNTMSGVIYGNITVAIVQGVFAAFGFYFLGLREALILGFLTVVAALIPFLGAVAVWLPISLYYILSGINSGNIQVLNTGIFTLLYGALVVSLIDNILRPKIVGESAKTHPLIVLFGTVGGLIFFGIAGVIIGPVVLALFSTCIRIYREEYLNSEW